MPEWTRLLFAQEGASGHDAFLSYSHDEDAHLVAAVHQALQQIAKPWYLPRWTRIYRDTENLAANATLWPALHEALSAARFLVLLASPQAKQSDGVQHEADYWVNLRWPDPLSAGNHIAILLVGGDIVWGDGDFDWNRTTALPRGLSGAYKSEPVWIDLRWVWSSIPSHRHPQLINELAAVVACIHDIPKASLLGEHVRQQRRQRRLVVVTGLVLAVISVIAVFGGWQALRQRNAAIVQAHVAAMNSFRAEEAAEREQETAGIARRQRIRADTAREIAERRRIQAEYERNIALARQLAFESELISGESPRLIERSTLLAIESLRRRSDMEADHVVRSALPLLSRPVRVLKHGASVGSLAYSRNGSFLATASGDVARVFETRRWSEVAHIQQLLRPPQQLSQVVAVALTEDGRYLATGNVNGSAIVYELPNGREVRRLVEPSTVMQVAFSPNGQYLATVALDGSGHVLSIQPGREVWTQSAEAGAVLRTRLAFSPDGKNFAITTPTGVRVIETAAWRPVSFLAHDLPNVVWSLAFSPDGRTIATGNTDKTARLYDVASGKLMMRVYHVGAVEEVNFDASGEMLATADQGGSARVLLCENGRELASLQHRASVHSVMFTSKYLVATASQDGTARLFHYNGREIMRVAHEDSVERALVSPDDRYLVTASWDGTVRITEIPSPGLYCVHEREVCAAAINSACRFLATVDGKNARVFDLSTRKAQFLKLPPDASPRNVALSADAERAAVSCLDGTTYVFGSRSVVPLSCFLHGFQSRCEIIGAGIGFGRCALVRCRWGR